MAEDDDPVGKNETPEEVVLVNEVPHDAKLIELLRNLTSTQSKLSLDASKEFIKILKSDSGPKFLSSYIKASPKCTEFVRAWELQKGKPGFSHFLKLVSVVFSHPYGKSKDLLFISSALDKFARVIVEGKMGDLYKELNSKEAKRQKVVLLLLASIVRRGPGLAWGVAKCFDFKIGNFSKLAEWKVRRNEGKRRYLTRDEFVGFATSFLEVGNPRLLREILQQKDMYSGVLRGLGNDDEEVAAYVLLTLRDRVLVPESLVPPGLRSVLFGSATLEQLIGISGRVVGGGGVAAEVAHSVLLRVCTDPSNGLMPDLERKPGPLKGNLKRLLDLMKKLKATEVDYHKHLLLAIVKGRPAFGSGYLDEFPYYLEDLSSPNWFSAVSLAADVMSSVGDGLSFDFVNLRSQEPPPFGSPVVQDVIRCIGPRPFTRLMINKGLLHTDPLVKHGTLRLVSMELKLLDSLIGALNGMSRPIGQAMHKWASLKQDVQNAVRIVLPDLQVLLSLLSSLNGYCKSLELRMKRPADVDDGVEINLVERKKLKTSTVNEDIDILVSGVSSNPVSALTEDDGVSEDDDTNQLNSKADFLNPVQEIWGLQSCTTEGIAVKDGESYFYSKLLDVLRIYQRTLPSAVEGSFDFFKILPSNPLALPATLLQSLLSLLIDQVVETCKCDFAVKAQPLMYKYLHSFINMFMYSPIRDIRDRAYTLAQAAMLSTGAFDTNPREICNWFLFIPGYNRDYIHNQNQENEVFQKLSSVVTSFLCDAVSTTGNNLFKYLDLLKGYICNLEVSTDVSPNFSPFVVSVLEKCLRLLGSESGSFTLPEKSMISLYVSTTLKYILETQVEAGLLSSLIHLLLSERLEGCCNISQFCSDLCEWRPLNSLLSFARSIMSQETFSSYRNEGNFTSFGDSFSDVLHEILGMLMRENHFVSVGVTVGFSFSMLCTMPTQILQNFPKTISISSKLLGVPFSLLLLVLFLEPSHFVDLFKLWPEICYAGLENLTNGVHAQGRPIITDELVDSPESSSAAFSFFVKLAPFHMLFPAVFFINDSQLLEHSKMQDFLLDKLPRRKPEHSISAFCHVLFYMLQVRMSYRTKPVVEFEELCESSFLIAKHILKQLLVERMDSDGSPCVWALFSARYIEEVAEIMFCHPLVTAVLECPLPAVNDITDDIFIRPRENFLHLAEKSISKIDHHVLNLLRLTSELLVNSPCDFISASEVDHSNIRIAKAFNALVQKLIVTFKEKFTDCMKTMKHLFHLIPTMYALNSLNEFICPFDLLELVNWLFSRIDLSDTADLLSFQSSALSVGLQVASCALDSLSAYMSHSKAKRTQFASLTGACSRSFDVGLFEKIFFCIFETATRLELDVAYQCLLKAVKVVKYHRHMGKTNLPFIMATSRLLPSIPLNFISHCMRKITKAKAELLFLLSEMSSLHLCAFGHLFSNVMTEYLPIQVNKKEGNRNCLQNVDELLMLLPTILLYIDSTSLKFGRQLYEHFENVISFFWRILLQGFSNWKSFFFKDMFEIKLVECSPLSMEELLDLLSSTLLGKAVILMQHYLGVSGHVVEMEERLRLFDFVCPCTSASDEFLDFDISKLSCCSLELPLNFANRIVAKIRFCRLLLGLEHCQLPLQLANGNSKGIHSELGSSRIRFLSVLVNSWQRIVENFHTSDDNSGQGVNMNSLIIRFLETFIGKNILELISEMHDCLSELHSFPFVDQLAKFSLLHRFEDPNALKILRSVLTSLPEGKFSCVSILQLLLSHSQFSPTITFAHMSSGSGFDGSFTNATSIMRSFVIPGMEENTFNGKNNSHTITPYIKKLELVKLLSVLIHTMSQQEDFDFGTCSDINFKELVLLLLFSYGATVNEIDLEIYSLMNRIEALDQSLSKSIAEMDYLWGPAALKVRKELEQVQGVASFNLNDNEVASFTLYDNEVIEEQQRIRFRENLPIDPKLCSRTVLCFPYNRSASDGSLCKLETDDFDQRQSTNSEKMRVYDPVFILRFSIHGLAMEYIEPLEFASLGLLAVTFMTLSSPDADIRKLGFEVIVRFKSALEKCQKRKDVMQLRLLLSYLQNSIEEECQRIPSVTTVFAAEASFVLLDSSHDHYSPISKALMQSSGANMKGIPLFQEFFWSSSVNFKSERLWMLRLLNSALNMDDDAQVLVRNSIFESLLNFYASPLSDVESKELIVQMIKKSVRIHKVARHLVVHCGIIPWLSSVVASFHGTLLQDLQSFPLDKLAVVLEVANDVISSRSISEWLQKFALEQLAELASHLYRILVAGTRFTQEQTRIIDLILQLLMTTLKISQKRKVYQPHFTLSFEGLYQLYEAVDACCCGKFCSTAEIGLKAILMSTPPVTIFYMDPKKLLRFVSWAISTAMQLHLMKVTEPKAPCYNSSKISEVELEENLLLKLLRWLTASVILGRLSWKLSNLNSTCSLRFELNTLQSLMDYDEKGFGNEKDIGCEEILAVSIFYLQQLLSKKWKLLPSVVSALCLLLFSGPPTELESLLGNGIPAALLFQKINSPAEANPAWRWSFYQPWRDLSSELSEVEKLEEIHACQKLLVVITNKLGQKSLFSHFLSPQDVENSQVFKWERTILDSK